MIEFGLLNWSILAEKSAGWFVLPGKVDPISWWLIVFFVAVMLFLAMFDLLIPGVS